MPKNNTPCTTVKELMYNIYKNFIIHPDDEIKIVLHTSNERYKFVSFGTSTDEYSHRLYASNKKKMSLSADDLLDELEKHNPKAHISVIDIDDGTVYSIVAMEREDKNQNNILLYIS